jgi:hypothetical protein
MVVFTEPSHTGDFIVDEPSYQIARENIVVTVPAGETLRPGTVLSRLSATGKYVPYDNAGTDGSEGAAGILYGTADNSAGEAPADVKAVAVVRDAAVYKGALLWADGVNDAAKTAAYADLAANHVIARD